MKKFLKFSALSLIILAMMPIFAACDDDTDTIGTSVMPSQDAVTAEQKTYTITSRTLKADSVLANTNDSYLGQIIDPESRALTTCSYLAQFHVMENTTYPEISKIVKDEDGNINVDSCDIRIFIRSYYGDSLATMKLTAYELDPDKIIEENENYYTNLDASQFYTKGKGIETSLSYAVKDLTRADSLTDGSTYYRSIIVRLPESYGRYLIEKYYEDPNNYANSYRFIRNVCPGFYFKTAGGTGSMVEARSTALNVYFKYHSKTSAGNDTIIAGIQRAAATEEVLQQTMVENKLPESLTDTTNQYTYIKTPAGLYTEATLPISDILAGEHYNDTINSASLSLQRYNSTIHSDYTLSPPSNLLLLRKGELYSFFENNKVPNSASSFVTTFSDSYNAYTFSNISKLIALIKQERDLGAGVQDSDTEAQRQAKYATWEASNPDWNKVVFVPVHAEYTTTTSSYTGLTSKTLLNVKNEFGLASVKLKGGSEGNITLDVVYSHFKN